MTERDQVRPADCASDGGLDLASNQDGLQTVAHTRKLSAGEIRQRQLASVRTGMYVKAENGLRLRSRKVRRLVTKMRLAMPWVDDADLPAARAWAELEIIGSHVFADLITKGVTTASGDPRRLLSEFRMLRAAQLRYEEALGMTPAARMSLKVGASRSRALDAATAPDADEVAALEERILERLNQDSRATGPETGTTSEGEHDDGDRPGDEDSGDGADDAGGDADDGG